jgi:hypothetical protein
MPKQTTYMLGSWSIRSYGRQRRGIWQQLAIAEDIIAYILRPEEYAKFS